uniref:Translationally-controlled tumor protein n=1 Tax=Rhinolophus ferrumequinum TaxID=59479 RepID=A0A671DH72_RHIFE
MIIYWDLISHDETFFNIYKIREITDRLWLEVEEKMVCRTEDNTDDSHLCGNASTEGPKGEDTENTVVTAVDIVMNHHLQEVSFAKGSYKNWTITFNVSFGTKIDIRPGFILLYYITLHYITLYYIILDPVLYYNKIRPVLH